MTIRKIAPGIFAVMLLIMISPFSFAQGSAEAGAGKVAACAACHGPDGNASVLDNVPKLGGQGQRYLLKQMQDIKSGVRAAPLMTGMLNAWNDQDLADIAAFYAGQSQPLGAVEEAKRAMGEKIYRAGIADIGVAACSACHATDGKGNAAAGYPSLSGQDVAYSVMQLKAFRAGERQNDEAEVMRTLTARLSDAEIAALASYIAGLR